MVRFLLLLILLLNPIRNSYAQYSNYCYCTTSWTTTNGQSYCTANADCWACAPGAYNTTWQALFCPNYQIQTCSPEIQTQTQSCPVNQSGVITQTKTKTCTTSGQGIWGDWVTTSNTCVQNPPTCQTSSQTQTLTCQTGYTGSITQTRSSTCPNPYGSPVWQPWVTTSDTCKKAATNPTNPVSPVNPASPTSPTSTTSVQTTQSSPATVSTPNTVPSLVATPTDSTTTSTETSSAPTAGASATSGSAPTTPATGTASPTTSTTPTSKDSPSPPKGKAQTVVGLVLSLELFQKPGLTQPSVFPDVSIVKGIPNEILMHDKNLMELIGQPSYNQPFEVPDLGFEQ